MGELEHALYHARKSAGVKADDNDATIFFQTVATMCLNFRRKYMKKHFPNCTDEMWCLGKAIETARQRVYEADEGDTEDLNEVDAIWNMVWGKITGKDLSGCSSCKDDKDGWSSGSDIAPQKLAQQFESATVLQNSNEHKSFIDPVDKIEH